MDKRKLITNICFILFSIALIVGVSFVFLFLISRYSVERSLRNLLAFSAVGIIAFIGFMLCGGYRIFKKTADGINGANAKSLLKKFVPAVSKKAWIICGSIVLVLPFVFEGVFCWLERANPSGLYHAYSFTNVLLWLVFFIIFGYLTLLYLSSRPKTLKSEEGVRFTDEHLSKWEYFLFGVIALGCFFLFNQEDLMITVGCSFGVLRGHISDYYDFMNSVWGSPNYMITTFLVFAIWNVPVRLITGSQYYTPTVDISVPVIWWNKLLLVLIFLLSVAVLFRICKKAGMNGSNSRLSCYLYACSPITIFSVFIFGQYDVLSVLMLLMGIYLLLDDRDVWSAFFIGIGLTFKITILLFYLPWLLIKRKNLVHVLGLLLISLAPYALLTIYYSNSSAFSGSVSGFGALNYIVGERITILGQAGLSFLVFPFIYVLICGYFYIQAKKQASPDLFKASIFASCLVSFVFFGLTFHHPQWFLTATPFLAILLATSKNKNQTGLFLGGAYFLYFVWVLVQFPENVDVLMLKHGALSYYIGDKPLFLPKFILTFSNYILGSELGKSTYFTVYSALLLLAVYTARPSASYLSTEEFDLANGYRVGRLVSVVPLFFFFAIVFGCLCYSVWII